ncbi:hypothetical protein F8M41_014662 [Gigaspora margarita]|uniref:Uncharacterized protein n=1 Tax=Gigaspora margarita TaxID=4874 RepID=A0A8H3WX88_GIGMA|nr:hypothetical protein F8M41_014662 [Gigaspora margarita]
MSTKNSKRSANDNISTIAKPAKRGCKKKENVDPLININYSQAKPNNVNKRGHKKKQETVASSSSQIIDELLNDTNNLQESRIVSQLLSSPSRQQSPIRITSQITAPSRQLSPALESRVVSPRQLSPTLGLRTNAQNNFVSSNQLLINPILTSSRMPLTSDSNFSNNILGQFNPNRIAAPSPFNEMSIYQAFNYTSRDTEGTKALDRLTKSIAVPS